MAPERRLQAAASAFSNSLAFLFAAIICLLWPASASAHLGSPNVFFEGPAGPYLVRVTIQVPVVVPGLAQISVHVESGQPDKVTVLPVRWNAGTKGAPPPDVAKRIPGETNLFNSQLWLMDSGAYSVFVDVSGPQGRGTAIVPLNSLALTRLTMPRGMSYMFLCLGIFLLALLVSVVGAAVREASLPAGVAPDKSRRIRAGVVMVIAASALAGLVKFGSGWWNSEDREFLTSRLYQAVTITPSIDSRPDGSRDISLNLTAPDYRRADRTRLIPDHGHMMHLFLVREPEGDVFAHLHPVRAPGTNGPPFVAPLPNLPGGDYTLYADITHESGFAETLTNRIHLSTASAASNAPPALADADDSVDLNVPQALAATTLSGGFRLQPNFAGPFKANRDLTLRFDVTTAAGAPAPLEPYLGMYGHLIIQAADGSVFTHLHPLGSISMAAQKQFAEREHASYLANQPLDLLCSPATPTPSFPYAFPKPGAYRIWLQIKVGGQILTTGYRLTVE